MAQNKIGGANSISNENLYKLKKRGTVKENFNTNNPKSIYGFTKLSSELLIKEYAYLHKIKYLINRVALVSGPWQFGKEEQGFVSLWVWKHINKSKMKYIGYGGYGNQVRDVLHINDLCELLLLQIQKFKKIHNKLFTVGGSKKSYTSLNQLTNICEKITKNKIKFTRISKTSIYDIPYYISDNKLVSKTFNWKPKKNIQNIVYDIYVWLKENKFKLKKYF